MTVIANESTGDRRNKLTNSCGSSKHEGKPWPDSSQAGRILPHLLVITLTCAALGCFVLQPGNSRADRGTTRQAEIQRQTEKVLATTVSAYQWLHAHPELSSQEIDTARYMATELRAIGLEVYEGIGGHGVVGILRGKGRPDKPGKDKPGQPGRPSGPVVLYRADMDGLPITETTGVSYTSQNSGVMHACGHDVHMATALGTLRVLAALAGQWHGTVLFVGQPAEEIGAGARAILADPAFQRILQEVGTPRLALALHDSFLPAGTVGLAPGYVNANADALDIVIYGKGGHGARPHKSIDPIVIGSEIVLALQTIVSRRLPPGTRAVITVGKFSAGTKHNIIAPEATLLLTVRSYEDDVHEFLVAEIRRVAENVARAHNAPRLPTITRREDLTPASYNDPAWAGQLDGAFKRALGAGNVTREEPSMGGEDFGRYARALKIPGVMWRLGAVDPEIWRTTKHEDIPDVHSDKWAPTAELTLRTGIVTATTAILEGLD